MPNDVTLNAALIDHLKPVSLHFSNPRSIALSDVAAREEAVTQFRYRILRNPKNIKHHMQYIAYLLDGAASDAEKLYGALVDLFYTLGSAGTALKIRLFKACRQQLSDSDVDAIRALIKAPQTIGQNVRACREILIYPYSAGDRQFIRKLPAQPAEPVTDPYEEALQLLEHGDLDEAMACIEQARQHSDDVRLTELLDEIKAALSK